MIQHMTGLSRLRARYRKLKQKVQLKRRRDAWRRARSQIASSTVDKATTGFSNLLIIPSDAWLIVGSRGDDAMVTTLVTEALRRNPSCGIGIVCAAAPLPKVVQDMGAVAVPVWQGDDCGPYMAALASYDAVVVIGADIMDGHFSAADAFRAWSFADLAARSGRKAMVIGFSFSLTPEAELAEILRELSPALVLCARESLSKTRFDAFSSVPAQLVADSAFLLAAARTSPDHAGAERWVAEQHGAGRFVCAINTHVMIFPGNDAALMKRFIQVLTDVLLALAARHPVAYLLVPHDFRDDGRGDNAALTPVFDALTSQLNDRVRHTASVCRASEIKGLVGLADLLITGRMHLGVGALALGVPMWAINPQDKFVGLFEHFGLPDQRLHPADALDESRLESFIEQALLSWPDVQAKVLAALPEVQQRAQLNFSLLGSP